MMKNKKSIFGELVALIDRDSKGLEKLCPPCGNGAYVEYAYVKMGTKEKYALGNLSLHNDKDHIIVEPGYKRKEKSFTIRPFWDEESGQCRLSINYPYSSQEGYSIGCDKLEIVAQEFLKSFSSPESGQTTDSA